MQRAAWKRRFLREEDGATAVEYGVLLGLIISLCFGAICLIGQKLPRLFGAVLPWLR